MKNFYWKEFIKKLGIKKFIFIILITICTVACSIWITIQFGFSVVLQSILFSILYDNIKDFRNTIIEVNEHYSIEK